MTAPVPKPRVPIEAKVQAGGLSAVAGGIAVYLLQTYAFKGNAVPAGLVSLIYAVVPGLLALAGGYLAPHTPRPLPAPPALPGNMTVTPVRVIPPGTGAPDPPPPAAPGPPA